MSACGQDLVVQCLALGFSLQFTYFHPFNKLWRMGKSG